MISPLPAETVLEARERNKRDTGLLLIFLIVAYAVFFNLTVFCTSIAAIIVVSVEYLDAFLAYTNQIVLVSSVIALLVALYHFQNARSKSIYDTIAHLGAKIADKDDSLHQRFTNIVEEAKLATGDCDIQAMVIPSAGLNAFSIEDGEGRTAIGATEGLISRLSRPELTAVIAHEAAHIVQGDSRLTTTSFELVSVFDSVRDYAGSVISDTSDYGSSTYSRGTSGRGAVEIFFVMSVMWLVSALGYMITNLTHSMLSRKREFMADAQAVKMCKDPLALAEALYTIGAGFRCAREVPGSSSSMFIMNPKESKLDEKSTISSDLFSTHPPLHVRLEKLLRWGHSDLDALKRKVESKKKETSKPVEDSKEEEQSYYVHHEQDWKGPYTPMQMLTAGILDPTTWVSPVGSDDMTHASEQPLLIPVFEGNIKQAVSSNSCPRCHVSLVEKDYDGVAVKNCVYCKGYLLSEDSMIKIVIRDNETFTDKEIKQADEWHKEQTRISIADHASDILKNDPFPVIKCPICEQTMIKRFQSYQAKVVIDSCPDDSCNMIWCDGSELEYIQIILGKNR